MCIRDRFQPGQNGLGGALEGVPLLADGLDVYKRQIVDAALDKNPDARICVSAIALESLSAAVAALTAKGRTVQVSQIAVSRARAVGGLHLMMAQNPIYLITGE